MNALTENQFDVLRAYEKSKDLQISQRDLQAKTKLSLGTINRTNKQLQELGYICDGKITKLGLDALEPYRVKRAIFLAAGFGSRLVPITLNTPKPLVRVNGKRIIDGLIDALLNAGIDEIYIVRGYLAEQFDQLLYKYPMVKFIENPLYNEANNISSALQARHLLSNAYILESDLLIKNPNVIEKYNYSSNYLGFKKERTDDWCFEVKNGIITSQKIGGVDCYQEVGISYWNKDDGQKLEKHLEALYNSPGGKEKYWDSAPLDVYKKEYQVAIRECEESDIVEIDTFRELKEIDKAYA